jgi:ubiquinone/menaquinone biosynthesis C-methylase UbiE
MRSMKINGNTILEIGSGMSPIVTSKTDVVYCDISFPALQILKKTLRKGLYVAADCMELPFKEGSFANVICSEVLEHVEDDRKAVGEIVRILTSPGNLVITFPHRQLYFSCDDHFVRHLRRYELNEMMVLLKGFGLTIVKVSKVLGLLEKIVMISTTFLIEKLRCIKPAQKNDRKGMFSSPVFMIFFKLLNRLLVLLAWLDAKITPLQYATVVMIKARKK